MSNVRTKILGSRARTVASVKLNLGGEELEVELREPNLAVKGELLRSAGGSDGQQPNFAALAVGTIVACAYEPGGIRPCFKAEDADALLAMGQELDPLVNAVLKLFSSEPDQGNGSGASPS